MYESGPVPYLFDLELQELSTVQRAAFSAVFHRLTLQKLSRTLVGLVS